MKTEIDSAVDKNTKRILEDLAKIRKEKVKDLDMEKYLKDFKIPEHSKKCKKCYGIGRVGYEYDPKIKERGDAVICPKFMAEIEIAVSVHAIKVKAQEDREAKGTSKKSDVIIDNT